VCRGGGLRMQLARFLGFGVQLQGFKAGFGFGQLLMCQFRIAQGQPPASLHDQGASIIDLGATGLEQLPAVFEVLGHVGGRLVGYRRHPAGDDPQDAISDPQIDRLIEFFGDLAGAQRSLPGLVEVVQLQAGAGDTASGFALGRSAGLFARDALAVFDGLMQQPERDIRLILFQVDHADVVNNEDQDFPVFGQDGHLARLFVMLGRFIRLAPQTQHFTEIAIAGHDPIIVTSLQVQAQGLHDKVVGSAKMA
jgi:hypothetical protein